MRKFCRLKRDPNFDYNVPLIKKTYKYSLCYHRSYNDRTWINIQTKFYLPYNRVHCRCNCYNFLVDGISEIYPQQQLDFSLMSACHQLFSAWEAGIFSFPKKKKLTLPNGNQSFLRYFFSYKNKLIRDNLFVLGSPPKKASLYKCHQPFFQGNNYDFCRGKSSLYNEFLCY